MIPEQWSTQDTVVELFGINFTGKTLEILFLMALILVFAISTLSLGFCNVRTNRKLIKITKELTASNKIIAALQFELKEAWKPSKEGNKQLQDALTVGFVGLSEAIKERKISSLKKPDQAAPPPPSHKPLIGPERNTQSLRRNSTLPRPSSRLAVYDVPNDGYMAVSEV
jgi:hypothetical protein